MQPPLGCQATLAAAATAGSQMDATRTSVRPHHIRHAKDLREASFLSLAPSYSPHTTAAQPRSPPSGAAALPALGGPALTYRALSELPLPRVQWPYSDICGTPRHRPPRKQQHLEKPEELACHTPRTHARTHARTPRRAPAPAVSSVDKCKQKHCEQAVDIQSVSQSVIFHGPAPRSPLHRLAVDIRRARRIRC